MHLKDKTTPTTVRIAMVQVAKGSTYDPRMLPNTGGGGAGGVGGAGAMGGAATSGGGAGDVKTAGAGGAAGLTAAGTAGETTSAGTSNGAAGGAASPVTGGAGSLGGSASSSVSGTTVISAPLENSSDDGSCSFRKRSASLGLSWLSLAAFVVVGRALRRKTVIRMS